MKFLLLSIPFVTSLIGLIIYRFQDEKQRKLFNLDLVQFMYLFVLSPTLYVWLKSFLYYVLRNELTVTMSQTEIFVVDTVFSVMAFFTFAAIAMHSLTKTFWLRRHHDPEFDLYHLSEYFHLYWTHIVIWTGAIGLVSFLAFINVFIPLDVTHNTLQFYPLLGLGLLMGLLLFMAIWGSDPGQGNFMRLMKMLVMTTFVGHALTYFLFDPNFKMQYVVYWFSLFAFLGASVASAFFENSMHAKKVRSMWLHVGWGENKGVTLSSPFKKKK